MVDQNGVIKDNGICDVVGSGSISSLGESQRRPSRTSSIWSCLCAPDSSQQIEMRRCLHCTAMPGALRYRDIDEDCKAQTAAMLVQNKRTKSNPGTPRKQNLALIEPGTPTIARIGKQDMVTLRNNLVSALTDYVCKADGQTKLSPANVIENANVVVELSGIEALKQASRVIDQAHKAKASAIRKLEGLADDEKAPRVVKSVASNAVSISNLKTAMDSKLEDFTVFLINWYRYQFCKQAIFLQNAITEGHGLYDQKVVNWLEANDYSTYQGGGVASVVKNLLKKAYADDDKDYKNLYELAKFLW